MNSIAIITARGGSKRIPKKNTKLFHGKPIIAYSIKAALEAKIFDEVMVSTDDDSIATISRQYGALIPFMRSKETSDDFAATSEVLLEVLGNYEKIGKKFTYACCIYPTAPFITKDKLIEALAILQRSNADSVIPIVKFGPSIWRSFNKIDSRICFNWPEFALSRSQDLPVAYHDAGQFYFFKTESLLKNGKLVTDNTLGMEMSEFEVQDIDTDEDWKMAELKYSLRADLHNLSK